MPADIRIDEKPRNPRQVPHRKKNTIIAILGMHRSGTSLAAQMVHALGVPMSANLMAANEYNERGYFEDSEVVRIQEDLLTALGRPWHGIGSTFALPQDWMQHDATARARASLREHVVKQFDQEGAGVSWWAVKDPRMARLLPLWLDLVRELDLELVPILCLRSPGAVAKSLLRRDRYPISMGTLLWTVYNTDILDVLDRGSLQCILPYEDWFTHPARNLARLTQALSLTISDESARELVRTVFAPDLRHHVEEDVESGLATDLYAVLRAWAATGVRPAELETVLAEFHRARQLYGPWQDSRESQFLEAGEAVRAAAYRQAVADAERYLAAYQTTDQARADIAASLQRVEQERDALLKSAQEHLAAYQAAEQARQDAVAAVRQLEQERDAVAGQAQEYLRAYQTTEQARQGAMSAIERLEAERDALMAAAQEHLSAYQTTERARQDAVAALRQVERERDAVVGKAQDALRAYQTAEQARQDAIAAIRQVEQERDALLTSARDHLLAYQTTEQARQDAIAAVRQVEQERDAVAKQAQDYLLAYQTTEQARQDAVADLHRVEGERDAVLHTAEANLAAYRAAEQARQDAVSAIQRVEQERDALLATARENLEAYRVADKAWADTASALRRTELERDAALEQVRELLGSVETLSRDRDRLTEAWQEMERKWKATLSYRLAAHPLVSWAVSKTGR